MQKRRSELFWIGCAAKNPFWCCGDNEGIAESLYYSWSEEFMEAEKRRSPVDTARQATLQEVKDLRSGGFGNQNGLARSFSCRSVSSAGF
jgi:hypothetical protein